MDGGVITKRYLDRMAQVGAQIDDELVAQVDELVEAGVVASRSEAVRIALRNLVEAHRRLETGRRIAEGYRRLPQDEDLRAWARTAAEAMIEAEPW
jgi:metal-responsive CopG/Arc/MetJ family transcriptional regulator